MDRIDGIDGLTSDDGPGPVRRIFRNRFHNWRGGWRMLFYVVVSVVLAIPLVAVAAALGGDDPDAATFSWTGSLSSVAGNIAFILAAFILLRFVDRRPIAMLGLGFGRGWFRELAVGVVAGLALTSLLVLILVGVGAVSLSIAVDPAASLAAFPLYLFIFTVAAALEELLFRGYLLQALAEGSRRWIAGAALCIPFAWAHADNPDLTMTGIANIFLAGVILIILYFQTRRLWLPIGFHLSWNLGQSWLWGFDVSGIAIQDQLFSLTQKGSDILTGGGFGLEGSILSVAALFLIVVWLLAKKVLSPDSEVAAMWESVPSGFGLAPVAAPETGVDEAAEIQPAGEEVEGSAPPGPEGGPESFNP